VRSSTISRNYAETLLTLAQRHGGDAAVDEFGEALAGFAAMLRQEPRVRVFLESPLVSIERKKGAIRKTLDGRAPEFFIRFLLIVVEKRRAAAIAGIAREYHDMVDRLRGRVRADVALARDADPALRDEIVSSLRRSLGQEVIATFRTDPALVGGVVVRVGDQILDGSVRRRAAELRRRLIATQLPEHAGV
jgi:F-type H+-transporting ATPase subunit delta